MTDPEEPRPEVLSYGREERPPPRSPGVRLLQLTCYAVGGFVVFVAALIGATSSASPLGVRIGCLTLVFAPIVGLVLFLLYRTVDGARRTYLDIRQTADPKARRQKIVGLIVSSLVLSALGVGRFWLRLESDRLAERRARDAAAASVHVPAPPPAPAQLPPWSSRADAAKELDRLINSSPPIITPTSVPTTRPKE